MIPVLSIKGVDRRYNLSYTSIMKTAISLPDPVFNAAEKAAQRLGMSRSALYARAITAFLVARDEDQITERLNRVYSEEPSTLPSVLAQLQYRSLPEDQW